MWFKRTPQKSKLTILMERIIFELGQGLVEQFFFEWIGKKVSRKICFGFFLLRALLGEICLSLKNSLGTRLSKIQWKCSLSTWFRFSFSSNSKWTKIENSTKNHLFVGFLEFFNSEFLPLRKMALRRAQNKKIYFEIRIFAWFL